MLECLVFSDALSPLFALATAGFDVGFAAAIFAKEGRLFSFPPEATTYSRPIESTIRSIEARMGGGDIETARSG